MAIKWLMAGAVAITLAGSAAAQSTVKSYSSLYVFGDSLSDTGNLADALGTNFASPPFYHDSFTNGPVAVAVLASRLGLSANPSLYPTGGHDIHNLGLTAGTNYAVAGATAAASNGVPGGNLPFQIGAFLTASGNAADPNALYTVFIGGNDVRTAAHQGNAALVTAGVTTELGAITSLYNAGARNFLIVGVPDIGVIPEFRLGYPDQVATAHNDTLAYNQSLTAGLATIAGADPAGSFAYFDLYTLDNALLANPGQLGITNTTMPCYTATSPTTGISSATSVACGPINPQTNQATNIDNFFYWDSIHPTAKVQAALGNDLADFILGVPEPGTWTTMILGFAVAGYAVRRRRVASTKAASAVSAGRA